MITPFLKWAGRKLKILPHLETLLPKTASQYIEPFAGSAAVFLNTNYKKNLIADNNQDLINLFNVLKAEAEDFISYCKGFFGPDYNNKEKYYELRQLFNTTEDKRLKAALFIYLNRHGFNGLCRYNSKGGFNVPFGQYHTVNCPEATMRDFHQQAKRATFVCADFNDIMCKAKSNAFVYCDPPYVPLNATSYFTKYSVGKFGPEQQLMLAKRARETADKGATVIISNHDVEFTREAYKGAKIIAFDMDRNISCNWKTRKPAKELLAIFEPK